MRDEGRELGVRGLEPGASIRHRPFFELAAESYFLPCRGLFGGQIVSLDCSGV